MSQMTIDKLMPSNNVSYTNGKMDIESIAKDKYDSEVFRDFGLVIFDEAHHAPSEYFSKSSWSILGL